jgi:hypothetical protein
MGGEVEGFLLSEPIAVESEEGLGRANASILSFPFVYLVYFVVILVLPPEKWTQSCSVLFIV